MKLSVACNFDEALLPALAPYPVYEVYGKLTHSGQLITGFEIATSDGKLNLLDDLAVERDTTFDIDEKLHIFSSFQSTSIIVYYNNSTLTLKVCQPILSKILKKILYFIEL